MISVRQLSFTVIIKKAKHYLPRYPYVDLVLLIHNEGQSVFVEDKPFVHDINLQGLTSTNFLLNFL